MDVSPVIETLGYDRSPHFIGKDNLAGPLLSPFSHVYRKAVDRCGLEGVYVIDGHGQNIDLPIIFYCKAADEAEADRIHNRVWNQDVAPFVLVETPAKVRLYCGFRYAGQGKNDWDRGILGASITFNQVADRLNAFTAESIDHGMVWDEWGDQVTPRTRVDWKLLDNLKTLGQKLREQGLGREATHALIGKFIYLRYLKDRGILSKRKLANENWSINPQDVFSRDADLKEFHKLNQLLDEWLNGAVFPLNTGGIKPTHLRLVAGVFSGDSPDGQLHLDFTPYDFSFIPIETLSVIYEHFLHASEPGQANRGKKAGAYYTPLPLVNYVLHEMERRRPLMEGMRVLDPSCGSGAFLVQCYRNLIEKRRRANGQSTLRPSELRELLVNHIFGVDRDGDACQVTVLSLVLTLLDYITPPDLERYPQFKLPKLMGHNIFQADFFDPDFKLAKDGNNLLFDWLVGNPPWVEFSKDAKEDRHVRTWVIKNKRTCPIGGNQIAEAFVWRSLQLLTPNAVAGLVLPAMTLFKDESKQFRQLLFRTVRAWCVANFANLAYVLFAGRSEHPAMTLFFSIENRTETEYSEHDQILTFAPFVLNQKSNRSTHQRGKVDTWCIVVNGSELGEVSLADAAKGDATPWKFAMWGTFHDRKLLHRINTRFMALTDFLDYHGLTQPHKGFELRDSSTTNEQVEYISDLINKPKIEFSKLKNCGRIFTFPEKALSYIPPHLAFLRKRGGRAGLRVSLPPHIIVDKARRFAVYSDLFIAISPGQIGIAGPVNTSDIQIINVLKALSVYLSSDFVTYQQFLTSPEWGVSTSISTVGTLINLPVPLNKLSDIEMREWAQLRDLLAHEGINGQTVSQSLIDEVNRKVFQLLGLGKSEKILVEDFVHYNMKMTKGKAPAELTNPPDNLAIDDYRSVLKNELDAFLGEPTGLQHRIEALRDRASALIAISLTTGHDTIPPVLQADDKAAAQLQKTRDHLVERNSQWLYTARNLRVYKDNTLYMLKPLERIHWTKRQAILDSGEVIAETMGRHDNQ